MKGIKQKSTGEWVATAYIQDPENPSGPKKRVQKTLADKAAAIAWRQETLGQTSSAAPTTAGIREVRPGAWRVDINRAGVRKAPIFHDLAEATRWWEMAHDAIDRGLPLPDPKSFAVASAPAAPTLSLFGELLRASHDDYYQERLAARQILPGSPTQTWRYAEKHILPILGAVPIEQVDREMVRQWASHMASKGFKKSTQREGLWQIRRTFDYGISIGRCTANPALGVQALPPAERNPRGDHLPVAPKREGEAPVDADLALIQTIAATLPPPDALALWAQRLMGLRISEVFGLLVGSVRLDNDLLIIDGQGGREISTWGPDGEVITKPRVGWTKGGAADGSTSAGTRVLVIPQCLRPLFQEQVAQRQSAGAGSEDPLFVGSKATDKPVAVTYSSKLLRRTRAVTGSNRSIPTHDLRKNLGIDLAVLGVSPLLISLWLGHEVGSYDGQATVTAKVYTKTKVLLGSPHIARMREVAETLDNWVETELKGILVPEPTEEDLDWITLKEAQELTGWSNPSMYQFAKEQVVPSRLGRAFVAGPGSQEQWYLSRSALIEWMEQEKRGLSAVAASYGIRADHFREWAEKNGAELVENLGRGTGHNRLVFTEEGYATITRVMEAREAFLEAHIQRKELPAYLGVSMWKIDSLISAGVLTPVSPTDFVPVRMEMARYFSREEVDRAPEAMRKAGFRRPKGKTKTRAA